MIDAETECHICFSKHAFVKCGYGLSAGFLIKNAPEKALAKLTELGLNKS